MNVRCYRFDTKEFYYPEKNEPKELCEFWGVVEGYKRKKIPYEITWGTSIVSRENTEVFAGDEFELIYPEKRNKKMFPLAVEKGHVKYEEGCFTFVSKDLPGHARVLDTSMFTVVIKGYAYSEV